MSLKPFIKSLPPSGGTGFSKRVVMKSPQDFNTTLDSTVLYLIDGVIDFTGSGVSIEVPAGGLNLAGFTFDVSKLICSNDNYTMFTSPVGGSGNLLGFDYAVEVSGSNSKVYSLTSATGFDAFEFSRINYNDCSSLGEIINYRQGLEVGTGRFGGTPSLTLSGVWVGGYRITTSIVRGINDAMAEPLFKAGAGFSMLSRFLTDINVDLGALAPLMDFSASNFPNPSTVQIQGAIVTRNGVLGPDDATVMPNLSASELPSFWVGNNGLSNTFVGGRLSVSSEVETTINTQNVFEPIAGVFDSSDLQHFDEPSNGQLRHLGANPREFEVYCNFIIDGASNAVINIRLRKFKSSDSTFSTVTEQTRQINALVGSRDVAFFNVSDNFTLDQNDYVFWEAANASSTSNITLEQGGFTFVSAR